MVGLSDSTSFLQLRLDVREPALVAGFGISRVLGSAAPQAARRNRHRVSLLACNTASRRSKGQVSCVPGARCRTTAPLIMVQRGQRRWADCPRPVRLYAWDRYWLCRAMLNRSPGFGCKRRLGSEP